MSPLLRKIIGWPSMPPPLPPLPGSALTIPAKLDRDIARFTLAIEQCDRKAKPAKYEELKRHLNRALAIKAAMGAE